MRSLGIDIGRHSIKVVEISANNRSYQITNSRIYSLNIKSNDLEIEILTALKSISEDFDTESAKVVTAIRQQYVSLRKLFFPFKERAKIQKSLGFELEDEIPLSIEKAVFDAKVLKFVDKTTEVVAAACPTEEVRKTVDLFNRCHIDPDVITPEFAALANLYGKWHGAPPQDNEVEVTGDKMIVHIGHVKSFVGALRGDQLVWGRSLLWGAEKIAQNISRSFQVPMTESIKMMPGKAFLIMNTEGASSDQIKMSKTVSEAFAPFLQSLRLTMMLANTEYSLDIQHIELMGGASQIKNIGSFFTQALEKPVNVVNPIDSFDSAQVQPLLPHKHICHIALGLAIEGIKRPINPAINFRQGETAKKNRSFDIFWEKWGYAAKLLCIAYFCYFAYGMVRESVAMDLEEKSNDVLIDQAGKIAKLKGGKATQSQIRGYVKKNRKKAKTVKLFDQLSEINSPVKWIHDVSQTLPPNNKGDSFYEVRQLKVHGAVVTLQGVADSQKVVSALESALKGVAVAGKVKTINPTLPPTSGKKSFAFQFSVKRKN